MSFGVRFTAELWQHPGQGGWHFVTVPPEESDDLRDRGEGRGFGSLRVEATTGETSWTTSVFPSKDGCFLLPVNKQVRRAEDLVAGDAVTVALRLLDLS